MLVARAAFLPIFPPVMESTVRPAHAPTCVIENFFPDLGEEDAVVVTGSRMRKYSSRSILPESRNPRVSPGMSSMRSTTSSTLAVHSSGEIAAKPAARRRSRRPVSTLPGAETSSAGPENRSSN